MTTETRSRETVKKILELALAIPTEERPAFLDQACAGDPELRREVESLLEHTDVDAPWQERPIVTLLSPGGSTPEAAQRIGPYRIEGVLGEGGMGTVVLAVREDDFEKKVALKVIQGKWVSGQLVERFRNERQILAQLEHPNIARILDGGTTDDGLPYFVMEYIEGEPIDTYCDEHRLSIRQRLELFLEICSPLSFAHRNLVVHRDLKPSNILVTGEGVPKLLDFGIAKQIGLDARDELAGSGGGPMTLKYASPEQIAAETITVGTDVYSLGVLLYELLSGHYPYAEVAADKQSLGRAILAGEPRPPSAAASEAHLGRRLAGDLDSIVLKAMHRDPDSRYGSVEELAQDVRRYLGLQPVAAHSGSWAYRTRKAIQRNRVPLAVAATGLLLIVAFSVAVTGFWLQAVREREQAEVARAHGAVARKHETVARERSEMMLDFMKKLFHRARPNRTRGEFVTTLDLVRQGESQVFEGLGDHLVEAELLTTFADTYTRWGLYDQAEAPLERAVYLLERAYPDGHPALAKAVNNLAGWAYRVGKYPRAEEEYRRALAMKQELPPDTEDLDLGKSTSNLATILMNRGAYEEAETLYLQSLEIHRGNRSEDPMSEAKTLRSLGMLYYVWGDLDRAEPTLQESLEIRQRLLDPGDTQIATLLASQGKVLHARERYEEAEALYSRALEIRRGRFGDEHPHVAANQLDLARLYLDSDPRRWAEGEALARRALEVLREQSPGSWQIAEAESVLGGYLARRGRFAEAEQSLKSGLEELMKVRGERSRYVREARERLEELAELRSRESPVAEPRAAAG